MTCNHNTINYSRRTFANKTHHLCMQCADCGAIVRRDNKLWLKPDDIPMCEPVVEFDEAKYAGEAQQQGSMF